MSIFGKLGTRDRDDMTRADRARWKSVRSFPEACELMAQWLEGRMSTRPGYPGRVDVDNRFHPGLNQILAGYCRAGFLTENSQAGCDDTRRYSQAPWPAWVSGLTSEQTFNRIQRGARSGGFSVYAFTPSGRGRSRRVGDWLRARDAQREPFTSADIRELTFEGCGDGGLKALCDSWQVTVYDPVAGRNNMWAALAKTLGAR